jgi:hypothetical protein
MPPPRAHAFRIDRLRAPAALLLGFLQRTPAVRTVVEAIGSALEPRVGSMLQAAAATAAALGAVDAVAGATTYTLSTGSPGHPSPYAVMEGSQIEGVAFALDSNPEVESPPESWTIAGPIPPGLVFGAPGNAVTSAGTVNVTNPTLTGTPTMPGNYTMVLEAWEYTGGTGLSSTPFTYEVVVNAGPTPTPTPTPMPGDAPDFTTQPLSVAVAGGTVALDAVASNGPSYQWTRNGAPVAGATDAILLIGDAVASSGTYVCVATNAAGTATSNAATVSVATTSNPGHLVNLSARAEVGSGGAIIFGGFAIGPLGTAGALPVLIRSSGPALAGAPFNVPGTLPDPQLQLFNASDAAIQTNNGWGGSAAISATAAEVGAFAWNVPTSHDAALDTTLATGTYTAQVSGQSGDTGDALLEIYDATTVENLTPSAAVRLVNLSARVDVGTGANVLFAGFVIGGQSALTVLIRASGPAIAAAPFDVPGTLPDPQLTLQDPTTGSVYAGNAGWGGDPEIASTAAAVGAFAWSVPMSHDAALLITLPPGSYTAAAAGSGGDGGVALVEVYEVQ